MRQPTFQVDFTERYRRDVLEDLCDFLQELQDLDDDGTSDFGSDFDEPMQSRRRDTTFALTGLTYGHGTSKRELLCHTFEMVRHLLPDHARSPA